MVVICRMLIWFIYPEDIRNCSPVNYIGAKVNGSIKNLCRGGGKILAECGGMMFLTRSLTARQGGTAYAMTGILPLDCTMVGARLHLGYRRIEYKGMELRGHEFHYSNVVAPDAMPSVAKQFTARGMEVSTPLYRYKT